MMNVECCIMYYFACNMAINTSSRRRPKSKSKSSTSSLCALSKMVKLIKIEMHCGTFHYDEVFAYVMLNLNMQAVSLPYGFEEVHEVHRPNSDHPAPASINPQVYLHHLPKYI